MNSLRNLSWRLHWYRQSELEGALLLGRMVRQVDDADLAHRLTRHCCDEARHAWLWARTVEALHLPAVRIHRSYQSFYRDHVGIPRSVTEVLTLTHVFEHRVDQQFTEELTSDGLPEEVKRTFRILLRDEARHLHWVASWLATNADSDALIARYRAADEEVYRHIKPYGSHLWDLPGLGEEAT